LLFLLPVKFLSHNIVTDVSGIPDLSINMAPFLVRHSPATADVFFVVKVAGSSQSATFGNQERFASRADSVFISPVEYCFQKSE
jgi:hypothetical protein